MSANNEISRSNPGPKGNTPIVPSWIEIDNLKYELAEALKAVNTQTDLYRGALVQLAKARNSISTLEQVHLEDKQINALLESGLNAEIERLLTNRTDLSNELIKCAIKLDRLEKVRAAAENMEREMVVSDELHDALANAQEE